jgi:hypothetical protein
MYTGTEHWYMDKQQRRDHVRFSRKRRKRALGSSMLKHIGIWLYQTGCGMERSHLNVQMSWERST